MRRLRATDGTPAHLKAAQYHLAMCQDGPPPMATLAAEMSPLLGTLLSKNRAVQDAELAAVSTQAAVAKAEGRVENTIRDLDAAAASIDRADPSLNIQRTIFPHGFGAEIDPDGDAQLEVLAPLKVRLEPFKNHAPIAPLLARLDTEALALKNALLADAAQEALIDTLFAEEQAARAAIREQIESAYGRLRAHFKTRPALAERYFYNEGSGKRALKKDTPPGGGEK